MAARAPTRQKTQNPRLNMKFFNLGFARREKWCFDQLLKLWFGLPSSSRSPMRFTESLRIEAAAKTITPIFGSTKGMTLRADTKPAIFPARLRYLSDFMTTVGFVNVVGLLLNRILIWPPQYISPLESTPQNTHPFLLYPSNKGTLLPNIKKSANIQTILEKSL
jgi:hypothetical protein